MSRRLCTVLSALLFATPAAAALPPTRPQVIMVQAHTLQELRAKLGGFADSAAALGPSGQLLAGEAAYWQGVSFERAGMLEPAIASYRRAFAIRANFEDRVSLIDALAHRGTREDALEERQLAIEAVPEANAAGAGPGAALQARLAWALYSTGSRDSALLAAYAADAMHRYPEWAKRLAPIEIEHGAPERAWLGLRQHAFRARGQDAEAMALLDKARRALGISDSEYAAFVGHSVTHRAADDSAFAARTGSRIRVVPARDGFPLQAFVFPAAASPALAPVVLALAPDDTLAVADSIALQLARAGHAVALWAPRGSHGSRAPSCPGPDAWRWHQEELLARSADDAIAIAQQLAREGLLAKGPWIAGATGSLAGIAIEAARRDDEVAAIFLVAPQPSLVERGPLRTTVSAASPPKPLGLI